MSGWKGSTRTVPNPPSEQPVLIGGCYRSSLTHLHSTDSSRSPGSAHTKEQGGLGGGGSQIHFSGGRQISSHGGLGACASDAAGRSGMTAPNNSNILMIKVS